VSAVVVCSKCKESFHYCTCEEFHPNELLISEAEPLRLTFGGESKHYLILNKEEAEALDHFFMKCGYISYEHFPDIHQFIDKKLVPFLRGEK